MPGLVAAQETPGPLEAAQAMIGRYRNMSNGPYFQFVGGRGGQPSRLEGAHWSVERDGVVLAVAPYSRVSPCTTVRPFIRFECWGAVWNRSAVLLRGRRPHSILLGLR